MNTSPQIDSILHKFWCGQKNMVTESIIPEGGTWNTSPQIDSILHKFWHGGMVTECNIPEGGILDHQSTRQLTA